MQALTGRVLEELPDLAAQPMQACVEQACSSLTRCFKICLARQRCIAAPSSVSQTRR